MEKKGRTRRGGKGFGRGQGEENRALEREGVLSRKRSSQFLRKCLDIMLWFYHFVLDTVFGSSPFIFLVHEKGKAKLTGQIIT